MLNFILPSEDDCALAPEENLEPNSAGLKSSQTRGVWHKSLKEIHAAQIKFGLSPSKKVFFSVIKSPLKMMKNAFYSLLKAFFALKVFKLLLQLFGQVGKTA